MKKKVIISVIISMAIAVAFAFYMNATLSLSDIRWGRQGSIFLELSLVYCFAGVVLLNLQNTKEYGQGVLLSGLLLLLIGGSVCGGLFRF